MIALCWQLQLIHRPCLLFYVKLVSIQGKFFLPSDWRNIFLTYEIIFNLIYSNIYVFYNWFLGMVTFLHSKYRCGSYFQVQSVWRYGSFLDLEIWAQYSHNILNRHDDFLSLKYTDISVITTWNQYNWDVTILHLLLDTIHYLPTFLVNCSNAFWKHPSSSNVSIMSQMC